MAYRTTTVDTYCTYTADACLHGTIALTISGLSLDSANVHNIQAVAFGQATVLAATSSVTIASGTATASLVLESATLIAMLGARREIDAQLFLWDVTGDGVNPIPAWNGPIKIRWAPEPTGYVATSPGTTAIDAAAASALVTAHAALTSSVHGITAAAATVLDDSTVAAMRTTLGAGDVVGPAGATDGRPALFDTATGKLLKQHSAPLGTAAAAATSDFEAAGGISTHAALTQTHGISAFGASLVDDASAATARATLGAYRAQTVAAPANAGGAVTLAFATDLILQLTLTSNWTSSNEPTGLADGETAAAFVTLSGFTIYAAPADTATAKYGPWTVTGLIVRVGVQRVGTVYYWTAVSF